jgi:FixJ family two-component response regulator
LIDDDKIMLFFNLKLKKHFDNSSIKSYFKSDVAFNFIHDNFSELENTVPIIDLNMPVMDGFQVLENLISISHTLKVIVTSSISDEDRKVSYSFVHG